MARHGRHERDELDRAAPLEWEEWEFSVPRGTTRSAVTRLLTELADREHWELVRTRVYPDGDRTVWLRRKVYKVTKAGGGHRPPGGAGPHTVH